MKKRKLIVEWTVLYFLLFPVSLFALQQSGSRKERAHKDTLISIIHRQDSMIHTFKDIQDEMLAEKYLNLLNHDL